MRNFFPAKVLLFGEHRVLRGSAALAVPLASKGVKWVCEKEVDGRLLELADYLEKQFSLADFRLTELRNDLNKGWQLAGNVPFGYGLGSSGTVCAAICFRYATPQTIGLPSAELRELLGKMESYFHGKSSGTDPLISFENKAAVLQKNNISWPVLPEGWQGYFFLLDTKLARTSGPLISQFLERYDHDLIWQKAVNNDWAAADEACINALLTGDFRSLASAFQQLSQQQLKLVPNLIPAQIQPIWSGKSYQLKLCGAGGGGFMLGFTSNILQTKNELQGWELLRF